MLSLITITSSNGFDEIVITQNDKTTRFTRPLAGDFAAQRNFALTKASGDWIFFLDSDETLSQALRNELDHPDDNFNGYRVRRLDNFFGRTLFHGETGRIKLMRFGKKGSGQWQRKVHEYWHIKEPVGDLTNPLLHHPHPTIKEFIADINTYTTIDALELKKEGKDFSLLRVFLNPLGKFFTNYFLKLGFLDGQAGFVMAYMMSLNSLITRIKLYEDTLSH